MKMRRIILTATVWVAFAWLVSLAAFPGSTSSTAMAAGNVTIRGTVTDRAGKPIRDATVTVALGSRQVSRFTDKDGRYQVAERKHLAFFDSNQLSV